MDDLNTQEFEGEHDEEGVYVYQAYCNEIADWAIEHQKFGGPIFKAQRMTWIKPSFARVLYRSGYAMKHNQERVLKIKLSHKSIAQILEQCSCKHGGGGSFGRVQWDPARDLMSSVDNEPRKMLRRRSIQIGIKGHLSELYVSSALSIQDVTPLAHLVGISHNVLISKDKIIMKKKNKKEKLSNMINEISFLSQLPTETMYLPNCKKETLMNLGLMPGETANKIAGIGRGGIHY